MKSSVFLILLFFPLVTFAQYEARDSAKPGYIWNQKEQEAAVDTDIIEANASKNYIPAIRKIVQAINTNPGYKTKTLENDEFIGFGDNGSALTGYFKNGELTKMNVWVGLSHCIVTIEYYMDHGKLIFAFEQLRAFPYVDKPDTSYFDYDHPHIALESRFYFQDGKLIKKISTGEPECTTAPSASTLLADSKEYSALLLK
jgi:hypothetical protein